MPLYPYAVNSLGEVICPGCGVHMTTPSHALRPLIYCSLRCKERVRQRGGRLTREALRRIIEAMG